MSTPSLESAQHIGDGVYDYVHHRPNVSYVQPGDPWLVRQIVGALEVMFGRRQVQTIYDELKTQPFDPNGFFREAIASMGITVHLAQHTLDKIPDTGPLVFVANHPYGVLDGLVMCDLAMRVRGNFRILIHAMLCRDQDLADYFLPIDFQPGKAATRNNIRSKNLAMSALADNIPVVIFPSGMVSTADQLGFGQVRDAPWTTFAAKLISSTQATVVPVYFHGQNSRKFHVASHIAEPLRMALLVNEVLNKKGQTLRVKVGDPLTWAEMSRQNNRQDLTALLYDAVQQLAHSME